MTLSYNGWPAGSNPASIGINTEWEPLPGHRFPGGCKSGDVETVLTYVVRQLDARVEPIDRDAVKDEWGWFYKASANSPDLISCHSSGTAFDYNATRHPNGVRGTWSAAQVAELREILAEASVVRWLGDASRTADEMHFEINGTTAEVAAAAARIRAISVPKPTPEPTPPRPAQEEDVLSYYYVVETKKAYCVRPWSPAVVALSSEEHWSLAAGSAHFVQVKSNALWNKIASGAPR